MLSLLYIQDSQLDDLCQLFIRRELLSQNQPLEIKRRQSSGAKSSSSRCVSTEQCLNYIPCNPPSSSSPFFSKWETCSQYQRAPATLSLAFKKTMQNGISLRLKSNWNHNYEIMSLEFPLTLVCLFNFICQWVDMLRVNPLVPRVQKIKIRNLTLNRLLIVEFVKKKWFILALTI